MTNKSTFGIKDEYTLIFDPRSPYRASQGLTEGVLRRINGR